MRQFDRLTGDDDAMSLLTAADLGKTYGADEIFSGLNIAIPKGARIALVGPNGAGKTSLLNILAGSDSPTHGRLNRARDLRYALLPQRPELAGEHSLWDEQLKAFENLRRLEARLAALERQMAEPAAYERALECYGPLQAEFERLGGYEYEARIKMVLSGLGFASADYDKPLPKLSGGQKTRALLGRLLLEQADLLILDEPTNHLDIQAVEWLEKYLTEYAGAVLAVSHDRYFIDSFAETIWELEYRRLQVYRGNYSAYSRQRALRRETLGKDYARQQAHIQKEREFIRRHMGSRGTAQAKGRLKKLETMKKRGAIIESGPRQRRKMSLEMAGIQRSGDQVIVTRDLLVGYKADQPILDVPDCLVRRGETVAIIGPNGVGKSTLLKTLCGQLPALAGHARLGAKVKAGYFAQAHETLVAENTLLDAVRAVKAMPISDARDWLGRFLFSGDDVFRAVASLSGGERGRLALAKLALQGANLLLLDEPSNHLDIDSQEVLQAVLAQFDGTILLVSHDRYLIAALATQIWELRESQLRITAGDYQEYLRERRMRSQREAAHSAKEAKPRRIKGKSAYAEKKYGLSPFELARRRDCLEATVEDLEAQLSAISQKLDEASQARDAGRARELGESYLRAEERLEAALEEWGRLAE